MIHPSPEWLERNGSGHAVCIIGAGPAGITLACELDGCGVPVLLLDVGGRGSDRPLTDDIFAGSATAPHSDPRHFRATGLGGTSAIWGGRVVPYDPIDFEVRDHVPNSGWPIPYEEVASFYPRALGYAHAGENDFSVRGSLDGLVETIPGLSAAERELIQDRIERYSLPTHFGRSYRQRLQQSRNVQVVLEARAVHLLREASGAIAAVDVVVGQDRRVRVQSTVFVLACGGLETARLLLASDPGGPGIGNESGALGRYYTCHIDNVIGSLVAPGQAVAFDFEKTRDGIYARRKLQFTAVAQREHRLLNSVFRLHFPEYSDASHRSAVLSTIFLAKSMLIREYQLILQHGQSAPVKSPALAHLRNVAGDLPALFRFAFTWLFRRVLTRRKLPYTLVPRADGSYPIEFNAEQMPLAANGIRLLGEKDRHGVPLIHIDWHISPAEVESNVRAFHLLRDLVGRHTQARVEYDEATLVDRIRSSVPVPAHHIGTARMAADRRAGVVDRDCRVFGTDNLYIASSATFPTSSHANPTLTIIAMALRLAATLRTLPRLQERDP
jgi:choline dehydrogenase-like flavoprotein